MRNGNTWELPFEQPARLELQTEVGSLTLVPVEDGRSPRLELSPSSVDKVGVHVEKVGDSVRVGLDPQRPFGFFGNWECRATLYLPIDVRASIQTNAGAVTVRDLNGCELGIKANAGKIELANVRGLIHLAADAGSVVGRNVGGFFDVETQAGSIRMEIADLQPGEHRLRAQMGSVRLELLRGMDIWIETHTQMGSVRTNYPSRQGAPARLSVWTEMGSVRIEEGGRGAWHPAPPVPPVSPFGPTPGTQPTAPRPPTGADDRPAPTRPADPELERVLKMVEAGDLSAQEADELLRAMGRV
jgi:hypothetical protein